MNCSTERKVKRRETGGSAEEEMLTFSREQRCIEAAVAVASLPPSPLCISLSPSFPLSPFLFSVQTDRDEKLAVDQNTPPSVTACYPPHMLSPPVLTHTRSLFFLLFLFPRSVFFSCSPYFSSAYPCCSSSLRLSLCSPLIFCKLPLPFSVVLPSSPLILSSLFFSHLLSTPLPVSLHLNSHV